MAQTGSLQSPGVWFPFKEGTRFFPQPLPAMQEGGLGIITSANFVSKGNENCGVFFFFSVKFYDFAAAKNSLLKKN